MEPQVPEEIKHRRSETLFEDLAPMNEEFLKWHIGRQAEALIEEKVSIGGTEYFLGHTKEYEKGIFISERKSEIRAWKNAG